MSFIDLGSTVRSVHVCISSCVCRHSYHVHQKPYDPHTPLVAIVLEECLALKQLAEHAKSQFLSKGQKVGKVNHIFLPEGIQIEDLTQASCHA